LGLEIEAEARTNQGRIDAVVTLEDRLFIFEFKLDKSAEEALAQIKKREYFTRYQGTGKQIVLVGANFDSQKRSLRGWLTEILE